MMWQGVAGAGFSRTPLRPASSWVCHQTAPWGVHFFHFFEMRNAVCEDQMNYLDTANQYVSVQQNIHIPYAKQQVLAFQTEES